MQSGWHRRVPETIRTPTRSRLSAIYLAKNQTVRMITWGPLLGLLEVSIVWTLLVFSRSQRERHRSFDDPRVTNSSKALELTHSAPKALDRGLDDDDISRMDRLEIPHLLDSEKVDQLFPILGFSQNQDRAHLSDSLGQDRRWEGGRLTRTMRQVPFVERDVLYADNSLVLLEFRDLVDQEEGISMRQDPLDGGVVEWEAKVCVHRLKYILPQE